MAWWYRDHPNLKILSVRNNNLKSAKSISFCKNLEQVYLTGNTNLIDLSNLSSCKKLKLIDVVDTQIREIPGWVYTMDNLLYFKYTKEKVH